MSNVSLVCSTAGQGGTQGTRIHRANGFQILREVGNQNFVVSALSEVSFHVIKCPQANIN